MNLNFNFDNMWFNYTILLLLILWFSSRYALVFTIRLRKKKKFRFVIPFCLLDFFFNQYHFNDKIEYEIDNIEVLTVFLCVIIFSLHRSLLLHNLLVDCFELQFLLNKKPNDFQSPITSMPCDTCACHAMCVVKSVFFCFVLPLFISWLFYSKNWMTYKKLWWANVIQIAE